MSQKKEVVVRRWGKDDDFSRLRRFWYDIYVKEMGRHVDAADHDKRELDDKRAHVAYVIVAERGAEIVGTLICTPSTTGALGSYESFYNMQAIGMAHPMSTAIITKLMVSKEFRTTPLSLRMSCELYRCAVPEGIYHPIIDCNDHLVPLFTRIGFKQWLKPRFHPDYGRVHILKLDTLDLDHLEDVRSPLLPLARRIAPPILSSQRASAHQGVSA